MSPHKTVVYCPECGAGKEVSDVSCLGRCLQCGAKILDCDNVHNQYTGNGGLPWDDGDGYEEEE